MERRKKIVSALVILLTIAAAVAIGVLAQRRSADYEAESYNGIAMGTIVSMKLYDETAPALSKQVMAQIDALEQTISWRVESSPVAALNRSGACSNETVSSVVAQCAPISDAANGAFDLTIGKVSELWDFGGEKQGVPEPDALRDALRSVDYKALTVDGASVTAKSGQHLDLGAVGKGLACDRIRALLSLTDIKGAVVSVGGSILCFGSRNKAGEPWRVAIRHPRREDALLGTIRLKEGFVYTSGDYEKFFEQDGKRYFHILDARTGYPARTELCSVTVVCDNGLLSDALSTACFLLGREESEPLLERYNASAVFMTKEGEISTFGNVDFTANES